MPGLKRVPFEVLEFDKKIIEMSKEGDSESNSEKIKRVKKIMLEVIKTDLTSRQKQLVMLYYYENMTMVEIAEQLGIDHSTVSRTLARARKNIMDKLKYYF